MNTNKSSQPSSEPIIKADNLHKTYLFGLEGVAALRGVSVNIKQGEFVIILGNSGGGKTSLLNLLGTIDKQTKVLIVLCREI
jgi:putative ABC transport system ATP-binding protein